MSIIPNGTMKTIDLYEYYNTIPFGIWFPIATIPAGIRIEIIEMMDETMDKNFYFLFEMDSFKKMER